MPGGVAVTRHAAAGDRIAAPGVAGVRPAADPVGVVGGHGEQEGSDDVAVDVAVVVAGVAGDVDDVQADGDRDGAVQAVEKGFPGQHQIRRELPGEVEVVVGCGNEQDAVVVFDRGCDGKAGGAFGVGAGDELMQQPIGDGRGHQDVFVRGVVMLRPATWAKSGMPAWAVASRAARWSAWSSF